MEVHNSVRDRHRWSECNPRQLEVPGGVVLHRHCAECGRDFLTDAGSGITYAVFVCAISFYRLDEDVTGRWLGEPCPGMRLTSDDCDRKRRLDEIPVGGHRGRNELAVAHDDRVAQMGRGRRRPHPAATPPLGHVVMPLGATAELNAREIPPVLDNARREAGRFRVSNRNPASLGSRHSPHI